MTPDTVDIIRQLGEKFGVTIDYLWPLLVNYTRWINIAWFVIDIFWICVSITIWIIGSKLFFRNLYLYNHRDDKDYIDYAINAGYMIVCTIVVIIFSIIGIAGLGGIPSNLAGIMVPEAKAIFDLLAQVKK